MHFFNVMLSSVQASMKELVKIGASISLIVIYPLAHKMANGSSHTGKWEPTSNGLAFVKDKINCDSNGPQKHDIAQTIFQVLLP
jgi:hypothetical protein